MTIAHENFLPSTHTTKQKPKEKKTGKLKLKHKASHDTTHLSDTACEDSTKASLAWCAGTNEMRVARTSASFRVVPLVACTQQQQQQQQEEKKTHTQQPKESGPDANTVRYRHDTDTIHIHIHTPFAASGVSLRLCGLSPSATESWVLAAVELALGVLGEFRFRWCTWRVVRQSPRTRISVPPTVLCGSFR